MRLRTDGATLVGPDGLVHSCAMGRAGLIAAQDKREGDGATPIGRWRLRQVHYRPDRLEPPQTGLPVRALTPEDGWCDAPDDLAYNTRVRRPYPASHEAMWREDDLYDIVVETDHNSDPVVPGMGSAIFLHCRRPDGGPTAGCIAVDRPVLLILLQDLEPGAILEVG